MNINENKQESKLTFVRPCEEFFASQKECFDEDVKNPISDCDRSFKENHSIIEKCANNESGINLPEGHVRATTFWMIEDNKDVVGYISIRHQFTEGLLSFGGSVGYEIRSSKRGQGYGKKLLQKGLEYCKNELKMKKLLITCRSENPASRKLAESCGAVYAGSSEIEGMSIDRLWVTFDKEIVKTCNLIVKENPLIDYSKNGLGTWDIINRNTDYVVGNASVIFSNGKPTIVGSCPLEYQDELENGILEYLFRFYNYDIIYVSSKQFFPVRRKSFSK